MNELNENGKKNNMKNKLKDIYTEIEKWVINSINNGSKYESMILNISYDYNDEIINKTTNYFVVVNDRNSLNIIMDMYEGKDVTIYKSYEMSKRLKRKMKKYKREQT